MMKNSTVLGLILSCGLSAKVQALHPFNKVFTKQEQYQLVDVAARIVA